MISGIVNAHHEATIRLIVQEATGQGHDIEVVIDTGFTGFLTLPTSLIATLGLAWRTRGRVILANGTEDQCDIYAVTVLWDGIPRKILIEAADADPLVGMALLYGHEIRIQVVDGGSVIIEALP